jgi:cell division protein FtsZ
MVEFERTEDRELSPSTRLKICVAGVGGGGLNVLDRISLDRMMEASLVSMHTDVRVLSHAMTPVKIQLGAERMRGIGSGGDPENGYEAAQDSREQIRESLQGHDMVFVCCGLGGGTGSGAAPVVAEIAKEVGAMVFVFATMPFSFEGRRRIRQAEVALEHLGQVADALILFENNRMGELTLPKEGIQKAFSQADQLIGHSVRAISTMVMQPGIVRMGIADLLTALRGPNSRCLFGFGEARGSNRVADALKKALKSPLVNQGMLLQNARNLLVHVAGGESLTLAEVEGLMKQLGKHVPEETQIMFGLAVEPKLGDMISVTLVSSLSAQEMSPNAVLDCTERLPVASAEQAFPEASAPASLAVEPMPAMEPEIMVASEAAAPAAPEVLPQVPVHHQNGQSPHPAPAPAPTQEPAPVPAMIQPESPLPQHQPQAVEVPVAPPTPPVAEISAPVQEAPVPAPAPVPAQAPAASAPAERPEAPPTPVLQEVDLFSLEAPPAALAAPSSATVPETTANASIFMVEDDLNEESDGDPVSESLPPAPQMESEPVNTLPSAPLTYSGEATSVPAEENEDVLRAEEALYRQVAEIPAPPAKPASIFSIIEDDEDVDDAPVSYPDTPGAHWADKYLNEGGSPLQPREAPAAPPSANSYAPPSAPAEPPAAPAQAPAPSPRPQAAAVSATHAPATGGKGAPDFKQSTFELNPEEVARFKGTDKTIVEGEDLDVPTWMRMRQKVKR